MVGSGKPYEEKDSARSVSGKSQAMFICVGIFDVASFDAAGLRVGVWPGTAERTVGEGANLAADRIPWRRRLLT